MISHALCITIVVSALSFPLGVMSPAQEDADKDKAAADQMLARLRNDIDVHRDMLVAKENELERLQLEVARSEEQRSRASTTGRLGELNAERGQIEIEEAVMRARLTTMEQKMAEIVAEVRERVERDPLLAELDRAIDDLERMFGEQADMLSGREKVEARWRIIEARIEHQARRTMLTDGPGGGLVESLRARIVEAEIDLSGLAVRRDLLERQIRIAQTEANQFDDLEHEAARRLLEARRETAMLRVDHDKLLEQYHLLLQRTPDAVDLRALDALRDLARLPRAGGK